MWGKAGQGKEKVNEGIEDGWSLQGSVRGSDVEERKRKRRRSKT